MESRMTICNMSIEAGARAGMIAPDETTFAYLEGRPAAPAGAEWEQALDGWRALATDEGASYDRDVEIDVRELAPQVTWGTNPGMVTSIEGAVPGSRRTTPTPTSARPSSARSPTWRSSPARRSATSRSTASSSARARTPASRTCARRHRSSPASASTRRCARWSCPGSATVKRQAEEEGLDRIFEARRLRVAARRLLDVPRHEPGHPRSRRALRLDVEPELRGPAGRRRPHASRQPGDGRGDGDRGPLRRHPRVRAGAGGVRPFRSRHLARRGARPRRTSTPTRSCRSSS